MARVHVFADEAGDFTFLRQRGASTYFIIGTVTMADCSAGEELLALRRELAWRGTVLEGFHATNDRQWVRDQVYDLISRSDIRIDVTILDKSKRHSHVRADPVYFYKTALYQHFKCVVPQIAHAEMS